MFPTATFNPVAMGFQYPGQPQPASIYQSQYGGFNPQIPIQFQQAPPPPRGQSLPATARQYQQPSAPYAPPNPPRLYDQYPPPIPPYQQERRRKHGSKNKKPPKQRNVSSSGATDHGLYSEKEKEKETQNRSPSLENGSKQDDAANNNIDTPTITNQDQQQSQTVEDTTVDAPQEGIKAEEDKPNDEEKKKRKSRSKKKKHHRYEYHEHDNHMNNFPLPPPPQQATFYGELPPHLRVHQQPLYSSYNQVYEESIRRGDVYQKHAKRSTRLPPEAKQKLLPHEDDKKSQYPIVGYTQQPINPYQPFPPRQNYYGPTSAPYNVTQPWSNLGGVHVLEEQKIDRLRNHIHTLETQLHKLQKKFNKTTLNNNHNNEATTKDESNRKHRRSKRDTVGSPRQTPVIVELNNTTTGDNARDSLSKKNRHQTENGTNVQQEQTLPQQSGPTTTAANNQSPKQQQKDSRERSRSNGKQIDETGGKNAVPPKTSREETAARLAHAAVAHIQARQQAPAPVPPPPPPQQQNVHQQGALPVQTQQQRNALNRNYNQSNNNELNDPNQQRQYRSVEKILDAFERYYMKEGKSTISPMKIKYIPEENNSTNNRQRKTNNNNRRRSATRSNQDSSSSSSSTSEWSSSDESCSGRFKQ